MEKGVLGRLGFDTLFCNFVSFGEPYLLVLKGYSWLVLVGLCHGAWGPMDCCLFHAENVLQDFGPFSQAHYLKALYFWLYKAESIGMLVYEFNT